MRAVYVSEQFNARKRESAAQTKVRVLKLLKNFRRRLDRVELQQVPFILCQNHAPSDFVLLKL